MANMSEIKLAATPEVYFPPRGLTEPLDCSTPALDLCIRKQPQRTPSPEGACYPHHQNDHQKHSYPAPETPSSTIMLSPGSDASSVASLRSESSLPAAYLKVKATRPFKAYPKDPLSLAVGVAAAETILDRDYAEAYAEFRKRMLASVQQNISTTNKNMRRTISTANTANSLDPAYWEKRRKNNEAAKRSRDARRAKEDEIAIRCAFLEQENVKLRYEVAALREETKRYRALLYK